jgi:phage head maturation protease
MTKSKNAGSIRIPSKVFADVEVRAETFNEDSRSVEVVWATGAPVKRYSWEDGYFMEELSMKKEHIRLGRFDTGMSVCDSHSAYSMDDRLGTVVPRSVRIENGKAYATIKLSRKQRAEELLQDLKDGHAFPVSVGYRIHAYEKKEGDGDHLPVLRAIDWEPLEISAVPVPADAGASSRKAEESEVIDVVIRHDASTAASSAKIEDKPMNKREAAKKFSGEKLDGLAMGFGITRAEGEDDDALRARLLAAIDKQDEEAAAHAEPKPSAKPAAKPAAKPGKPVKKRQDEEEDEDEEETEAVDTEAVRKEAADEARASERKRIADITSIGTRAGMKQSDLKKHVDDGTSVADFRNVVFDQMLDSQERSHQTHAYGEVRITQDEVDTRRDAVINALMHRIDPGKVKLEDSAREWRGLTLLETGRELLRARGEKVMGKTRMELAGEMFARAGLHTTSDFPIILEGVTNRTLRAAYDVYPQTFKAFTKRVTAVDFRDMHRIQVGEVGDLKKVNEHGEYESTTFGEAKEKYRIATYGRIIGITRQVIINDDLGVFTNMAGKFGNAVARLESRTVWNVIIDNMKMFSDNTALFHANHGNLGTAALITPESVNEGRSMMAKHKDIDDVDVLDIKPKFLLHAPEVAFQMAQLFAPINATKITDIVPEYVRALTPIEEGRLSAINSGKAWFMVADPNQIDTIEYAYLEGNEGPYTETEQGFDIDGMRVKVRQDFGAAPIDWRGLFKNNGPA